MGLRSIHRNSTKSVTASSRSWVRETWTSLRGQCTRGCCTCVVGRFCASGAAVQRRPRTCSAVTGALVAVTPCGVSKEGHRKSMREVSAQRGEGISQLLQNLTQYACRKPSECPSSTSTTRHLNDFLHVPHVTRLRFPLSCEDTTKKSPPSSSCHFQPQSSIDPRVAVRKPVLFNWRWL